MKLNVYTVSYLGVLIVRDEENLNELSRRVSVAARDVTVAALSQGDAVDYAKSTLPSGVEISVQHVVQICNQVEVVGAAAAGENLVLENEKLKTELATLQQQSGLASFQLNETNQKLKAELELTQKAFAASQQSAKPEPPLDQQLASVAIPSEFDKPMGETPAPGSAPAA